MSESIAGDEQAPDWVGCLVFVLAAESLTAVVADAVAAAERSVLSDPVLADMARVSMPQDPISLHAGLDEIALGVYREMTAWGASPARNPAPRFTFCLLALHDNLEAADQLVRELAGTELLSDLPILFRLEQVAVAGSDRSAGGVVDELVQLILDAVTATALEVETAPQFCLSRSSLADVTARRSLALTRTQAPEPAPPPPRPTVSASPSLRDRHAREPSPPPIRSNVPGHTASGATAAPESGWATDKQSSMSNIASPAGEFHTRSPAQEAATRAGSTGGSLLPRRRRRRSNVETIDRFSQGAMEASMLYLVLLSEPTRPARGNRRLRADVALQLARTVLGEEHPCDTPWIVRVFEAGETLHGGSLFADAATVTRRSFRQRWGEYLDFYECIDDLNQQLHHDMSSFARRNLRWAQSVAVFLAGGPFDQSDESASRFSDLSIRTKTIWVSFGRTTGEAGDLSAPGNLRQLRYHEDILSEMIRLITGPVDSPRTAPSADEPIERSGPAAGGTVQTPPPASPHGLIETDGVR